MHLVCLDLEGVLVPEIWIAFAERTGIPAFARTTRDEPDYDRLMRYRLALLREHGLKLADIQQVIAGMGPLDGAKDFLDALRARYQVVILSDTFYEFADPLMRQLGRPTLMCHRLEIDADGFRRGLPAASARPEAPRGRGVSQPQLPCDRGRRLLQRHQHARRGRCRLSDPPAAERDRRIPAVPGAGEPGRTAGRRSTPPRCVWARSRARPSDFYLKNLRMSF